MKHSLPLNLIAQEHNISIEQVQNTIALLEDGCTIPFIARYRKDTTGNLDEVIVEAIQSKYKKFKEIADQKIKILKTIGESGKLTTELQIKVEACWDASELEDIYLPFKPRKVTKADKAIAAGLAPLAAMIIKNEQVSDFTVDKFVKGDIDSNEAAIAGAVQICAQWISERERVRNNLRLLFRKSARLQSKLAKPELDLEQKYKDYYNYDQLAKYVKSHQLLALLRGDREGILSVSIAPDRNEAEAKIFESLNIKYPESLLQKAVKESYSKSLKSAMETAYRNELKKVADESAIAVFASNLSQLLLQAPVGNKRTLAIDPGYKSGCKVVVLNEFGELKYNETIFPHPPQRQTAMAAKKISTLAEQYKIDVIAIGNGTAGRETEAFIKRIKFNRDILVFIVNEAGASIYSASKIGREEFPNFDVTVRGAVSIGRRLMDPLSELVKIDPKSVGVGQYQHDVDQNLLKEGLDRVVERCVNLVGVELNQAGKHILQHISGIGPQLAENIVKFRQSNGAFNTRQDLLKVPKFGPKAFEQAAGFIRISGGNEPLDNSAVHPENYGFIEKVLKINKRTKQEVIGNADVVEAIDWYKSGESVGSILLEDIKNELKKPGRDPRKSVKVFAFDAAIKSIDDLKIGYELPGIVNNVTNFGAFVDIGIKENGLIHISQLSTERINDPTGLISLHQHVRVEILAVEKERKRIALKLVK